MDASIAKQNLKSRFYDNETLVKIVDSTLKVSKTDQNKEGCDMDLADTSDSELRIITLSSMEKIFDIFIENSTVQDKGCVKIVQDKR